LSKLSETFSRFIDSARFNLKGLTELPRERTTLKFVGEVALERLVDEIEKQRGFHALVVETRSVFTGDYQFFILGNPIPFNPLPLYQGEGELVV